MNRRALWIPLALAATALIGCGKPKPREVTVLQLDGKVVELKASDRDTLAVQFGQLCQVAGFLLSNINVQDQPAQGTASASKTAISSILNRTRLSSEEIHGDRTVSTLRASMQIGPGIEGLFEKHNQLDPKAAVDPNVHAKLRARLNALRSGWQVAVFYESNTAPEASVKEYESYLYQKVTLGPSSVDCLTELSEAK